MNDKEHYRIMIRCLEFLLHWYDVFPEKDVAQMREWHEYLFDLYEKDDK